MRRFELSGTTRQGVRFEHIEAATLLAESLGNEYGLQPLPVTPAEVEAAYLRRMKAAGAELGAPPEAAALPRGGVESRPAATYRVGEVEAMMLYGGQDVVYATTGDPETGVLLRRDDKRGVIMALPVRRGRPHRGMPLMTTPLAGLDLSDSRWNRVLCA